MPGAVLPLSHIYSLRGDYRATKEIVGPLGFVFFAFITLNSLTIECCDPALVSGSGRTSWKK
jgi:hypothetical protein